MTEVPGEMLVTTPVGLTGAIPGREELHDPPTVASARDVDVPSQKWSVPVIGAGAGATVTGIVI